MSVAGAWVCLLAPLAGALAITLAGTRITRRHAGWIATLSVFVAFAGAVDAFVRMLAEDAEERTRLSTAYTWLEMFGFQVDMSILVDPLSVTMMLVVSGVGGLIVWYSMGYMAGADEERRYFAYMALFVFSMLLLVEAGNFLLLLVGWGLVGLASYLLIGFDHHRPAAIAAAKKAFVMNAIGDATMALAFFLLINRIGTLEFQVAFDAAENGVLSNTAVTLVALGLLGGAVAKSAQVPLHTWLPDAMEGPTPVSALIHAATMVTAGVYLICRTHPIFEAAPEVQHLAAILGLATLLLAGAVALVQHDIKRVIAYSTMSQIGYMFVGAGVGAYGFAMFHLVSHAFFKALLFLSAGLIIHHLAGEQDTRRMGGLRRYMPRTHLAFLVGTLALMGIPPLVGFWSKDAILASTLDLGGSLGWVLYVGGILGAVLTGLYAIRLYWRVFHGEPSELVLEHCAGHGDEHAHGPEAAAGHEPHRHAEGPLSMLLPVGVLTLLTAFGGILGIAGVWEPLEEWLDTAAEPLVGPSVAEDYATSLAAVLAALVGGFVAWRRTRSGRELVTDARAFGVLEHKLFVDELYDAVFSRPVQAVALLLRDRVEAPVVLRSLDEVARGSLEAGTGVARVQSGLLRTYALVIAASVTVLAIVFLIVR
jgi:NADH-quinone oxidoreductase subunit L